MLVSTAGTLLRALPEQLTPSLLTWGCRGGVACPWQHNLRCMSAQALGYITNTIRIKKNAANACANTTHGIHISGIEPPPLHLLSCWLPSAWLQLLPAGLRLTARGFWRATMGVQLHFSAV